MTKYFKTDRTMLLLF